MAGGYTDGDEAAGWAPVKVCKDCGQEKPLADFYKSREYFQPRCKPCHNKKSIEWAKANPTKVAAHSRKTKLKDKYGLSPSEYDAMLTSQGGGCAICGGQSKRDRPLDIDHCHETGKVRGLLCDMCNKAIGMFYDSPKLLFNALAYLGGKA